jgi:Domain of unknown function (DUF4349)
MPSPELIAPERLEELLYGALPERERESRVQGLLRELRAPAPRAPEPLRTRVRALHEPSRGRLRFTRRRAAVALAAVVLGAAGVVGGASWLDGDPTKTESAPLRKVVPAVPFTPGVSQPLEDAARAGASLSGIPSARRARDVDMWIEVRVRDADSLSGAANEAMGIARELGGYVSSSNVGTEGSEGRAELALRVPVDQVEEAVVRLSQLGTITGQRVATQDLQREIDRASARIASRARAIRIAELTLESGTLDAEERLRLEIRLERLRSELDRLRATRTRLAREAATAELTFVLHTREAPAGAKTENRVAGAARDALDFLGRAGSVTLFLAIVMSPLLLIGALVWLALRARSRRIEAELLSRSGLRRSQPGPETSP